MSNTRFRRRTSIIAAGLLLLAACGGDDTTETTTTTDGPTGTSAPAPAPTTAGPAPTSTAAPDAPVPELAGTSWNVTLYAVEGLGMVNVWDDTEVTIDFNTDGTISGFSGCNTFDGPFNASGPYLERDPFGVEPRGQAIELGPLARTEIACESDNVMEQEAEFFAMVDSVARWFLNDDGNLVFIDDEGFFEMEAEPLG